MRITQLIAMLDGKVALVTGGSSGIGRAASVAFAREGARVTVADVNLEGGEETVDQIRESGGQAIFVQTDVSQAVDVEAMVAKTLKTYGRLDCAFNNAGIAGDRSLIHEHPENMWDLIISIHLKGVWLCMKYEITQMLEQGGGAIVNTSSVAGMVGYASASPYVAAKHGIVGLTKTAALEYARRGIRANAISPGWTRTELIGHLIETSEQEAKIAARHPMGRLCEPEEIAAAATWLCSDTASFVTGAVLPIDGGFVAQ